MVIPLLLALTLHSNNFQGAVPGELCPIGRGSSGNLPIIELGADCLENPATGETEVICPDDCCTKCCYDDGDTCTRSSVHSSVADWFGEFDVGSGFDG